MKKTPATIITDSGLTLTFSGQYRQDGTPIYVSIGARKASKRPERKANARTAIKALRKASAHLHIAHEALKAAADQMKASGSWYLVEDLAYYRNEVAQLLSCDDGEAGMDKLLGVLEEETGFKA